MIVNLVRPRNAVHDAAEPFHTENGWFAAFPAAVGVLGVAYHLPVQRHRTGVPAEHRAERRMTVPFPPHPSTAAPESAG